MNINKQEGKQNELESPMKKFQEAKIMLRCRNSFLKIRIGAKHLVEMEPRLGFVPLEEFPNFQ